MQRFEKMSRDAVCRVTGVTDFGVVFVNRGTIAPNFIPTGLETT